MTSEYSISVDWREEYEQNPDKWVNRGRQAVMDNCKHHDKDKENNNIEYAGYCDKCQVGEDSNDPMMNYAYPLYGEPSEEAILKVFKETNCTVMENSENGEFFLALTGGGMDLSQDIALAYLLCDERIPDALAYNVSEQYGLSKSGKSWFKVMIGCEQSLSNAIIYYSNKLERIREEMKKHKEME